MNNDIYIDTQLKGRSFSANLAYEDADGYVAIGGSRQGNLPDIKGISIHLNILSHITIYGGPFELDDWNETPAHLRNRFMWDKLFGVLTPDLLKDMVATATKRGHQDGENELRQQFKDLFQL